MITVIGEALIDIIVGPDGEVRTAAIGGAPLNTTRTLSRLGVRASFLGGVSTDVFGRRIMRMLESDGVHLALGHQVSEPTTLAIAELDDSGAATYRFVYEGTSATAITPSMARAALDHLPEPGTAIHAGTLGLVFQPLADATRAVIAEASDDCLVMIDPNCRPAVMGEHTAFRPTLDAVLERADVVKVSADDLMFLMPGSEPADAARELQRSSSAVILFTDGSRSVRVLAAGVERELPVPKVSVVDTVGAGDAFSGGFLADWTRRGLTRRDLTDVDALVRAAMLGITVASMTCQQAGAQPPFLADLPAEGH